MTDLIVPNDLWDDDNLEAAVTAWLVDDGKQVSAGDLVAEIMSEKVQHEITAPGPGTLRIRKEVDAVVRKGDVLAVIE